MVQFSKSRVRQMEQLQQLASGQLAQQPQQLTMSGQQYSVSQLKVSLKTKSDDCDVYEEQAISEEDQEWLQARREQRRVQTIKLKEAQRKRREQKNKAASKKQGKAEAEADENPEAKEGIWLKNCPQCTLPETEAEKEARRAKKEKSLDQNGAYKNGGATFDETGRRTDIVDLVHDSLVQVGVDEYVRDQVRDLHQGMSELQHVSANYASWGNELAAQAYIGEDQAQNKRVRAQVKGRQEYKYHNAQEWQVKRMDLRSKIQNAQEALKQVIQENEREVCFELLERIVGWTKDMSQLDRLYEPTQADVLQGAKVWASLKGFGEKSVGCQEDLYDHMRWTKPWKNNDEADKQTRNLEASRYFDEFISTPEARDRAEAQKKEARDRAEAQKMSKAVGDMLAVTAELQELEKEDEKKGGNGGWAKANCSGYLVSSMEADRDTEDEYHGEVRSYVGLAQHEGRKWVQERQLIQYEQLQTDPEMRDKVIRVQEQLYAIKYPGHSSQNHIQFIREQKLKEQINQKAAQEKKLLMEDFEEEKKEFMEELSKVGLSFRSLVEARLQAPGFEDQSINSVECFEILKKGGLLKRQLRWYPRICTDQHNQNYHNERYEEIDLKTLIEADQMANEREARRQLGGKFHEQLKTEDPEAFEQLKDLAKNWNMDKNGYPAESFPKTKEQRVLDQKKREDTIKGDYGSRLPATLQERREAIQKLGNKDIEDEEDIEEKQRVYFTKVQPQVEKLEFEHMEKENDLYEYKAYEYEHDEYRRRTNAKAKYQYQFDQLVMRRDYFYMNYSNDEQKRAKDLQQNVLNISYWKGHRVF